MYMTLSRSERTHLLTRIDELVSVKFYDPVFGGKNWGEIVDRHRDTILNADSNAAFDGAVTDMLLELPSSGLGILGPETKITPRNSINASLRSIRLPEEGMRWVFQDVLPGGVAELAGIRSGDALIAIDKTPVVPPERPAFRMAERVPVVISRDGQRRDVQVALATQKPKFKDNPYSEPKSVTARVIDSAVGSLKVSLFPGFLGIDFANTVTVLFAEKLKDTSRLLLDLRGNPGGGVGGLRLMSYLTSGRQPVGYSLDRVTAEHGYDRASLPRFSHIPRSKLEAPLLALKFLGKKSIVLETEGFGKQGFHGRVVILVNEHSTGAAEMLTQFAQENGLATVVGNHTPGHLVTRSAFKIGHGYRIVIPIAAYMSWNGNRIEGKGIAPDVPIDWSYEQALRGADNQLDRALEVVRSL
jgi:carboxyl-terminal processing protease